MKNEETADYPKDDIVSAYLDEYAYYDFIYSTFRKHRSELTIMLQGDTSDTDVNLDLILHRTKEKITLVKNELNKHIDTEVGQFLSETH